MFSSSTICFGDTVISAHAGENPLLTAFRADLMFDQAEQ